MKSKLLLSLFSAFTLSGCLFSQYMVTDEEAYKWGKEEGITMACLQYSKIPEVRNIPMFSKASDIGIVYELRQLAYNTVGESVFGQRFHHIKNDYLFHKSGENRQSIMDKARSENSRVSAELCSSYLRHYENAFYQLKGKYGY
ncbi:hypothetical protein [Mannheimia granulomatis]|uniref:hypothetical protein n=1 Tax=Mannheimia granulomatis TaxID=85402 RepID=UPI00047C89A5|nr:hypothetical protein [Mannheimia granulomatis]QLB18577.1 hypothetical protein A6B41_03480 [Mannheimia granulomatis]